MTVLAPDLTKIIVALIAAGTVAGTLVYVDGMVERAILLSKPGSAEERRALERRVKLDSERGKGGVGWDGLFSGMSWLWRK